MRAQVSDRREQFEPFKVNDFIERLKSFVEAKPAFASRAYASAARRVRAEASMLVNKKSKLELNLIANRLDTMSAESALPDTSPRGEEIPNAYNYGSPFPLEHDRQVERDVESESLPDGTPISDLNAAWYETQLERYDRVTDHELGSQTTPSSAIPGRTLFSQTAYVQFGGVPQSAATPGLFDTQGSVRGTTQEGQVCRWDGHEEETQAVTVAIFPNANDQDVTYPRGTNTQGQKLAYRAFFHAFWGTSRGQPCEVFGDVGRGVQFVVACCYLNVNVGMEAPPPTYVSGSMAISGTIGFNPSGTSSTIIRTRYVDNLATGGGTQNVTVPLFASQLLALQRSDVSASSSVTLNFKDAAGSVLYAFTLTGSTQQQQPIPVSGEIFSIDVVNNGNANVFVALCFQLSL